MGQSNVDGAVDVCIALEACHPTADGTAMREDEALAAQASTIFLADGALSTLTRCSLSVTCVMEMGGQCC